MDHSRHARKWAILFAVVATQFAVPFMLSAVGVCLPSIGREFGATAISLSLVESVFLGVNAMCLLPVGRAADLCGRGGIFLIGLVIFALSTVGLTLAPTMTGFLGIRAIQGVGGAMTLATGLALLYDAFPREERGRALGISVAGIYLGISAGPFLGGLFATLWGWRWVFYAGMAPCALALLACLRNLDWKLKAAKGTPFDWWGSLTSALAVGLLVAGSAHPEAVWGRSALAAGALALLGFLAIERRTKAPLIHLGLFMANRAFSLGVAAIAIVTWAAFGVAFLLSLYLQYGRGMTAAQAGTLLVIQPVIQCVVAPVFGRMADRVPAFILACIGALLTSLGLALAAVLLTETSGIWPVVAVLCVEGLGIGIYSTPSMVVVMSAVEPAQYGIASAMTGQSRTLGMTACMAAVTMVIAAFVGDTALGPAVFDRYTLAMRIFFAGCAVIGLGGTLLYLRTRRQPATPHAS